MHFLESFALSCGAKIDKPQILEKFYPLDIDKFISFYPYEIPQSRRYDYWTEFMRVILPTLNKNEITMLQMGRRGAPAIETCKSVAGELSANQAQYVIRNSILHLGVNGFTLHLSSSIGKKTVALFSESPPETNGPYFTDENFTALTPDLKGEKYSYCSDENPKTINTIRPEDIAKAVCSMLDIELDYPYKTIYVGDKYSRNQIEYVPSRAIDISNLNVDSLIVRMDKVFDERALYNQLVACSCSIVTNKPINMTLIKQFKGRIAQFIYLLEEGHDKKYIQELFDEGVQCLLLSRAEGKELDKLKLEYLDYGKIHKEKGGRKEDLECLKGKDLNNIFYKSSKYLINEGKIYLNEASMDKDLSLDSLGNHPPQKVIDREDFWEEHDYYTLLEKI